jgi:hypothetical protein
MAANLGPGHLSCQLKDSSAPAAVKRGPECGKLRDIPR